MKTRHYLACMAAILLAAACVPSVYPFYTEKDLVFEPALVGMWVDKDNKDDPNADNWVFEKSGEKAYKLIVTEGGGKRGQFEANLFKLKEQLFLDLICTDAKLDTNVADIVSLSLIPGHLLVRVSQLQPKLQLSFMNTEWLDNYLKEHPKALAHVRAPQERTIITAPTSELQKFILSRSGPEELFADPGELVKREGKK